MGSRVWADGVGMPYDRVYIGVYRDNGKDNGSYCSMMGYMESNLSRGNDQEFRDSVFWGEGCGLFSVIREFVG